jgi:hypothetical protein
MKKDVFLRNLFWGLTIAFFIITTFANMYDKGLSNCSFGDWLRLSFGLVVTVFLVGFYIRGKIKE